MPEEAQIADQKASKETPVKTPHKINWIHILIGVVFGAGLLGAGFGVYLLTQSKGESSVTSIKTSTSSAKQATPSADAATPSADKDETADWKVVTANLVKVKFKVPSEWEVKESDGLDSNGEKINIGVTAQDIETKVSFVVMRNPVGGLSLDKTREEQVTIDGFKATKVYFQDRQDFPGATKGEHTWVIWPSLEVKGVKYDINAGWSVGDKDFLEILNKILTTLEFI